MPSGFSISVIIIVAAAVWAISLLYFGVDLSWDYAKPFSVTVAVVTGLLTAFDRVLWRYWPFPLFHKTPDLSGQWAAELLSSYVEQGGRENKTVTGTATITQTYPSLSVRLVTGEEPNTNRSFQLAGRLIRHDDGVYEVIGVYQSDPDILARGTQTEIHYGAFRYRVIGTPPDKMSGHYWTDRNTRGSIQLKKRL
jgi:SMODS-associating 2TM, beta-strand rich effector domain